MTRTKVAKLLYLADVELNRARGRQATEVRWKWHHHGPFDDSLFRIEEHLRWAKLIEMDKTQNYYGTPEVRLELAADPTSVTSSLEEKDPMAVRVIADVVTRLGHLAASALKDLTYRTEPMRKAQGTNARGQELDLDIVIEPPPDEVARVLEQLREEARQLPEQESDGGVMDDLADELASLRRARVEANRDML
jgi:uncharacterized phage-associated protein